MENIIEEIKKWIHSVCQEYIQKNAETDYSMTQDEFQDRFNNCMRDVRIRADISDPEITIEIDC